MPNYKQLCADLVDALTAHGQPDDDAVGYVAGLLTRARADLAEPESASLEQGVQQMQPFVVRHYTEDERPTIKGNGFDGLEIGEDREEAEAFVAWINEKLARSASLIERLSPPQPVPVSERLPGAEDCDAEGMCWWYCAPAERWLRCGIPEPNPASQVHTHWLPAHALPQPS